MAIFSSGGTQILGLGIFEPAQRVSSRELLQSIDAKGRWGLPDSWLERTLGVRERRIAEEGTPPSQLALPAAKEALDTAELAASELELCIFTGMARDAIEPATAHILSAKLGAKNAVCIDMTNACHGFMNGIHYADTLIRTGQVKNALVATGETNWRIAESALSLLENCRNKDDFLYLIGALSLGDAGAALVLGPTPQPDRGFIGFTLEGRSEHYDLCVCRENAGGETPFSGHMDMIKICEEHVAIHASLFPQFITKLQWRSENIDRFVHHQVGRRVFKMHANYSGIPLDRMTNSFDLNGNITTATVPFNLYKLKEQKQVRDGLNTFVAGAGSGLSVSQGGYVWAA